MKQASSIRNRKALLVVSAAAILLAIILFLGSLFFATHELEENKRQSNTNFIQIQLINSIHSSMAHLSMWQNTYRYADSTERFLATKNIKELTTKIRDESLNLQKTTSLEKTYVDKLNIAIEQLLHASVAMTSSNRGSQRPSIQDSLIVDYRSVYRIAEFHLSMVQEITLQNATLRSSENQMNLVRFLGFELVGFLIIGTIIIASLAGRKKIENTLVATEEVLTDLFESMPSALVALNEAGNVVRLNRKAHDLCSDNYLEGSEKHVLHYFPFLQETIEKINGALSSSTGMNAHVVTEKPRKHFEITLFPMTNTKIVSAVLRFDDVTNQEELAEQIRHTQKMNAIGQLAGGIAHDFNNVLGGILNASELIRLGCEPDEQSQLLDLITDASSRAADLTRKLLTFSKKDIHKIESVSINKILHAMESILHHSIDPRISTILHLEAGEVEVKGDAANLQNMFLNLGINAGHAMPDGGTIVFSTLIKELTREDCNRSKFTLEPGRYLAIDVADTGSGIQLDVLEHIFDPFFTTKENGTGIGLAAAYGTVQQCGGEITVTSVVGEGTTFRILLRCVDSQTNVVSTSVAGIDLPEINSLDKQTILVVDDEFIIRKSVSLILKRLGYSVILGENGRDGVELFRNNKDQIDMIMLDMMMPVMSGDAALQEIREISSTVPVLICTGFAHQDNLKTLESLSYQGMMTKPYSIESLKNAIDTILVGTKIR